MLTTKTIRHCLESCAGDDARLISEIKALAAVNGSQVYQLLLHILADREMSLEKAESCWCEIISLQRSMAAALGRPVSLLAVVCDYFTSIARTFRCPRIMELDQYEKLVALSQHDDLTGLYNRRIFTELMSREVSRAERYGSDLSLLFFDLDDFKKVNDSHGHLAGDEVLRAIARIIMTRKRNEDIAARYGGEEIVLLLPETGKANALILGEHIRKTIENLEVQYAGRSIKMRVSAGLASFPYDATSADNLFQDADAALYRAKVVGKNMICLFSPNQRRYFRVNYRGEIKLSELGPAGVGWQSVTGKDISGGGMLFESNRQYSRKTRLQAMISLGRNAPILLTGAVAWNKGLGNNIFATGMAFAEIDSSSRKEILGYMLRQLDDSPSFFT